MRCVLPLLLCFLVPALACAQQQEEGMLARMDARSLRAMKAMGTGAKPDPSLASPLQNRDFGATSFKTKGFGTSGYAGARAAKTESFTTRSFLGIKNPWIGAKVYKTAPSHLTNRRDREADDKFAAGAFETKEYNAGRDLPDRERPVPLSAQPREFVVQGKTQGTLSRFTDNLQKDLSIDDVRDLLNKGKGAGGSAQP